MFRFLLRVLVSLGLVLPLVVPAPAVATNVPPWEFWTINLVNPTVLTTGQTAQVSSKCPGGYVAVGGSFFASPDAAFERYGDWVVGDTYTVWAHAYAQMSISVRAICARDDEVGTITLATGDFGRDGNGNAGGVVSCPNNGRAIFGAADWNAYGSVNRRIDGSAPTADGTGWFVSGWSAENTTLHVEAYCIAAADLGAATVHTGTGNLGAFSGFQQDVVCPAGKRTVSGGAAAWGGSGPVVSDNLSVSATYSSGSTIETWRVSGHTAQAVTYYQAVWCMPRSVVSVAFDQVPPALTNSTSGTITFDVTEQTGEAVGVSCFIDNVGIAGPGCPSGSVPLAGLGHGAHTFIVEAVNQSGSKDVEQYTWTVDLLPPEFAVLTAPATLTSQVKVNFTEAMKGFTGQNVTARISGTSVPVPGTMQVVDADTVGWTPARPLTPNQDYLLDFGAGITDLAGNALGAGTAGFRAPQFVESDNPVVVERWDRDTTSKASGGSYAASRSRGSSLTWSVQNVKGKRAVVYGQLLPQGGKAAVYVDGVKKGTISFYASSVKHQQPLFTSAALSGGTHTIELRVLGQKVKRAKGTWVVLDRLKVGTKVAQESASVQRFATISAAGANGGSYETVDHATGGDTGGGPTYTLVFDGTQVHVYGTTSSSSGKARIYVDNVLKQTVSLTSSTTVHKVLVASVTGLSDAVHTLKIVPVGTKSGGGSSVGIDAVHAGEFD
ncbi:MAG TPA: Ig-like domain-containing protein [Nocardioidaceae bacterium]|nr:Ig-like domain-containing protein [Nocardioidaceae bacterium]